MADIKTRFLCFAFLFVVFSGVIEAYTYCYDYSWPYDDYYCSDNQYCCEEYGESKCCSNDEIIAGGAIAGMVIGGLFVCGLIFVCICICVQKSKAKQGVVIHPTNHAHVAFMSQSVHTTQHMPPAYGPPGPNNMYGGPMGPSNMYGGQQVAPPPNAGPQAVYPPNAPPLGFQTQK